MIEVKTAAFVLPRLLAHLAANSLGRRKSQREEKNNLSKEQLNVNFLNQCWHKEDDRSKEELNSYNLAYLS